MRPDLRLSCENRVADIYDRRTHFTIEQYQNNLWQAVRTARTLEEAKVVAENYINEVEKPILLKEKV